MAMNDISIEAQCANDGSPGRPRAGNGNPIAETNGAGMEALGAGDYCHLAEECFFLAAVENDPDAAAKLVKTGDDYLQCAARWFADQLRR
jgi:hypothetical protein